MYVPNLSYSHVNFNTKLANLLIKNGYNVTMLIVDVDPEVKHNGPQEAKVLKIDVGLGNGILPRTIWKNPGPYENASPLNPRISLKLVRVSSIFVDACKKMECSNQQLKSRLLKALFHTFQQFPQITFFLKYESVEEELKQVRHNVYLARWIPQIDLLGINI
uniref:glucuronosyltransferase n=1 Tax=Ditylenchus dipsaci TaxID=166011 RepID=A0A915E855_9BILA